MYERFKALVEAMYDDREERLHRRAQVRDASDAPESQESRQQGRRTHATSIRSWPQLAAAAIALAGARAGRLCHRRHRRADRPAGRHQRAADRGAAHLSSIASTPPAASTARRSSWSCRTTSAEPSKAAANAKKLLTQDNVILLINCEPVLDLCAGGRARPSAPACRCCSRARSARRKSIRRPSRCSSAPRPMPATYDSRAALAFIKETAKEPVKIGFAAMAIPLSRGEIDYRRERSRRRSA